MAHAAEIHTLEIEAGGPAPPLPPPPRKGEVDMRGWSLASAAAIVLVCLVVQTAVQLRTIGVISSHHKDAPLNGAALALRTSSAALQTAAGSMEKTSAALSELAPPVVKPPTCGSMGFKGAGGFEAKHKNHRSRFLTIWTDLADDSKVYFEFELAALRAKPLTLGIGAVHARGAMAHFDASPYGVEDVAIIRLAADGSGVDFQMWDMKHRTEDEAYTTTLEAGILPGQELRLLQVGSRGTLKEGVCEATHILVDASPLVAEGFFATDPRPPPGSRPHIFAVKGHPDNVGLTASYPAPPGEAKSEEGAEDELRPPARMVIRFSIYHLSDNPMPPRVADDRAGYFLTEFRLLGDYRSKGWHAQRPNELINPQVRFINRQRVRKPAGVNKDGKPIAELGCAGCKPGIHFYVDPTVPAPFHQATKEGVHRWRAAFKPLIDDPSKKVGEWSAVGDEVIYAHAPGDESWPEDYDVGDFRFNTISWAMGEGRVFAVGMSVVDPRSGEILKANIVFTLGWLESWLGERLFYTAFPLKGAADESADTLGSSVARRLEAVGLPQSTGTGASALGRAKDHWHGEHACNGGTTLFRKRHPHESVMCRAFYDHGSSLVAMSLAMKGATEDEALDFLRQGIADVTSHEVGHTLGLRHNFQGSLLVPFDKTQDAEWVAVNGLSSSVMDYLASNVISEKTRSELVAKLNRDPQDPRSRAPFFTPIVGAYDRWAVKYGYTPLASETYSLTQKRDPKLIQIAGEYADASFSFATDEDADSFDPFTRRFDLTSDPVAWQEEQYKLVREINAGDTMYDRAIRDGESWTNIAVSAGRLIRAAGRAARALVPFTSGLHASRRHARTGCIGASCVNEVKALRVMDAERQERALSLIFEFLRADMDGDLLPDRSIQGHLVQRKDFFGVQPFDMASAVVTAKVGVLTELLSEERLGYLRVAEELGDTPEARKLIGTLLDRCSKELVGGGRDPEADMPAVKKALQEPVQHEVAIAYYAALMERTKSTITRIAEAAWGEVTLQRALMHKLASDAEWAGFAHAALEALKAGEAALNIFEELGNTKGWEAAAWGTVVRAHLGKQDYTTALRLAKDAFRSFQSRADEAGELAARSLEVEVNLAKDDKVEALRAAEKCLDGVRGISKRTTADRRFEASILHMVAQIQLAEEDFSKASETGRDALRLFQDCAEKQHQALVLQTLSNVCIGLKEYREAVKLATESRDIFRKRGHRRGHAYACLACCHAYCARGEHNRGISMGKEALKIFTEEKHRKGEANAYAVLGEVYLLKGNGQKALSNAKEALVAFKELGQPHRVLEELFIVAKAAFLAASEGGVPQAKGQKPSPAWDNALQAAQEALATARRQGTERSVVAALFGIGQVYVITRRPDDASKIIEEALPLARKLGDDRAEANFEILAAQMHIMNGRDERAVEPARRAIEIFKDKLQDTEGESAASEIIRYVEGGGGGPAEVSIGAEDSQAAGAVQEYQGPSMEDLVATISDVALSLMGVESLAADTPLMDAGLDSLASVEFQNNLQKEFVGVQMPSTLVFDFPSVNTMAEFIYGGMREAAGFKPVSN